MFAEVDVLLTPAAIGPAPDRETTGDPVFNAPWSYLGWPTVSFPIGTSREGPAAGDSTGRPAGRRRGITLDCRRRAKSGSDMTMGLPPLPE